MAANASGIVLPPATRAALSAVVDRLGGLRPAAERIGLARGTVERAVSGLGVRRTSLEVLRRQVVEVLGPEAAT